MKILSIFIASICFIQAFSQNEPKYPGCNGVENEQPLIQKEPELFSETQNGQKYQIRVDQNYVNIVNVTGTPYQMGYAYGVLMGKEIQENFDGLIEYAADQLDDYLDSLNVPKFLQKKVNQKVEQVVLYLLDQNWDVAKPYIPDRYPEELQGMADGSGLSFEYLKQMNMIPELIKASCSIVGAWKNATVDNKLLTLRALDWDEKAPISRHPSITVYHSSEEGSFPFSNIGYAGLIGTLTSVGSQGVSIQEKLWWVHPEDRPSLPTTYKGKPWAFVLRDLAQFGTTLENMAETLENTDRTCRIHIGMASTESDGFEIANYSWKTLDFFNDQNYTHFSDSHPYMNGVAYVDRYAQPSNNRCIGQVLSDNLGEITWATLMRQVGGWHKTGDSQICVSDVQENTIYLAYSEYSSGKPAYERSPMFIDLKPFYGTKAKQFNNIEQ